MSILVAALLAQSQVVEDRRLHAVEARMTAIMPQRFAAAMKPAPRKAGKVQGADGLTGATAAFCSTAAKQPDPDAFLQRLARTYRMTSEGASTLRTHCLIYVRGLSDGRR